MVSLLVPLKATDFFHQQSFCSSVVSSGYYECLHGDLLHPYDLHVLYSSICMEHGQVSATIEANHHRAFAQPVTPAQ